MNTKPHTVRFSEREERKIQAFLKINPFLDFSSMARIAIEQFIEDPHLTISPLTDQPKHKKEKNDAKQK